MIRILETVYKIEANRHEFDVLKKTLELAASNDDIKEALAAWEHDTLRSICVTFSAPPIQLGAKEKPNGMARKGKTAHS